MEQQIIKDKKTAELAKKYPTYREYKTKGAKEGGWGMSSLERRFGSWNKYKESIGLSITPQHNSIWDEEDLLKVVKKYGTFDCFREAKRQDLKNKLPGQDQFKKVFGGWGQARIAAGLSSSSTTLCPDSPTLVYLIWFVEDDVFKVGITQKSVQERFKNINLEYYIIDTVSCTYKAARALEKNVLAKYAPFDYPALKNNGSTECFKSDKVPGFWEN